MVAIKITNIQWKAFLLPLKEPLTVAFGTIYHSENILLEVSTDAGITGYGEAAPLAFVTGETASTVKIALKMFKFVLLGEDPLNLENIHKKMNSVMYGNNSAKCAIDLALHDIWGKSERLPVYKLLGGQKPNVQNDITIGIDEPSAMAKMASHFTHEMGFSILKIKVGGNLEKDVAALRLITKTVPKGTRLRVDANQGYTLQTAKNAIEAFAELNIEAIEQPLPYWDFAGTAKLHQWANGKILIMLDESIHSVHDAERVTQEESADILNIKLMKCGGLYPATLIAKEAENAGIICMVGCMIETRLASSAGLSLVAAKKSVTEADCDSFLLCDDTNSGISGGFTVEKDMIYLSNEPGFGLQINKN